MDTQTNPIAAYLSLQGKRGGRAGTGAAKRRGDAAHYAALGQLSAQARRRLAKNAPGHNSTPTKKAAKP